MIRVLYILRTKSEIVHIAKCEAIFVHIAMCTGRFGPGPKYRAWYGTFCTHRDMYKPFCAEPDLDNVYYTIQSRFCCINVYLIFRLTVNIPSIILLSASKLSPYCNTQEKNLEKKGGFPKIDRNGFSNQ